MEILAQLAIILVQNVVAQGRIIVLSVPYIVFRKETQIQTNQRYLDIGKIIYFTFNFNEFLILL
jgi:hypothetical protein